MFAGPTVASSPAMSSHDQRISMLRMPPGVAQSKTAAPVVSTGEEQYSYGKCLQVHGEMFVTFSGFQMNKWETLYIAAL